MKRKSPIQLIVQVMVGYFIAGIFMLSFLAISSHAIDWLGLHAPLSEATVLMIAAVMAAPLVLPFALERINKFKIGIVEFDLKQVSENVKENLAIDLVSVEVESSRTVETVDLTTVDLTTVELGWEPGNILVTAIKEAETAGVIEVNLGAGRNWLSTRLFLLAALVEDHTGILQMIFLENRQGQNRMFVGSATPASVLQGLAWDSPRLKEVYEVAKREPAHVEDKDAPERKVAWIAQNFVTNPNLDAQNGEEGLQEWVTSQFLDRRVQINKYCLEWNGGLSTTLLLYQILDRIEPYVFLVTSTGQLNLVIDRLKLAEQIAEDSLRQRLE